MNALSPAVRRPQLTTDELHQLKWLLGGLLTLMAVSTVAYMEVNAWILMSLTAGVSLATTVWPALPARVPRAMHVLAFPFIVGFFTLDLWLRSELLPAMVRLDMLLLLYRAVMYRQRRDDLQVIVLGLFLVVVAGVLTVSLMFAAQILAYSACALVFLLTITLLDANGGGVAAVAAAGKADAASPPKRPAVPSWAAHVHWGRLLRRAMTVTDWRVVALSGGLFVGVIGGSALLFVIIPRFQLENGMFLDRFISRKARTGFSDSIRFGDVTEIQQDTSVALHIDTDPAKIPRAPYWRMLILDEYSNGVFRMSPAMRSTLFVERPRTGVRVQGVPALRRTAGTWVFYLESGVSRYLPLLGRFQQLRFAEAQTYQWAREPALLALTKDPVTMTAYQVEGFNPAVGATDPPSALYADLSFASEKREGPPADDLGKLHRILAEAVPDHDPAARDFTTRVCEWLRERHPYSLSPRVPTGGGDPLVRWLDSREGGHCELFAGSFVLLARAAGFPARVVTGFRGGTWNSYSTSFVVRNSDAHAWAEIYDQESRSWLRADPLEPPASAQSGESANDTALGHAADRGLAARLDSLRVFWYRRVVSFDEQSQVRTFRATKELIQSVFERLRERVGDGALVLKTWWRTPWNLGRIGYMAGIVLAAAALTLGWRRLRLFLLQWSFWRRPERRDDPIRREAGRWLRRMSELQPVTVQRGAVVVDLQRLRFGARETWPDPATVFRRARVALRKPRS